jgi:hypothetical protein
VNLLATETIEAEFQLCQAENGEVSGFNNLVTSGIKGNDGLFAKDTGGLAI